MQTRVKSIAKNVGEQVLEGSKGVAKGLGTQFANLANQNTPNYKVSTAASILFLSIYELAAYDDYLAKTLAILGFAGSTYLAVKQFGTENVKNAISEKFHQGVQAVSNQAMRFFKPASSAPAKAQQTEEVVLKTEKECRLAH